MQLPEAGDLKPVGSFASRDRSPAGVLDATGLGLAVAAIGWTFMAATAGGDPRPVVALILALSSAVVVGRMAGLIRPWIVPTLAGIAVLIVLLQSPTDAVSTRALSGPFHYSNAKGVFFAAAAAGPLMVAAAVRAPIIRVLAIALAAMAITVPIVSGTDAAAGLAMLLPAALLASRLGLVRVYLGVLAAAFLLALGATIFLGASYGPGFGDSRLDRVLARSVTERRMALWSDALVIIRDHPIRGVGPGNFQFESPTARDPDARWAHNEFLQQGAEGGLPAMALAIGIALWGFARLAAVDRPDAVIALAGACLGILIINATIDYVLHFPAIPLVVAALVGSASAGNAKITWLASHRADPPSAPNPVQRVEESVEA